jgi:hypothetical protein
MYRDFDILDVVAGSDTLSFSPTDRQISFKLKLTRSVSPSLLAKLDINSIRVIKAQISPFTVEEVTEWMGNQGFHDWLLNADPHEIKLYRAKEMAADTLIEILGMRETDEKTLALRLKAADILLKQDKVTNKTVNKLSLPNGIPKELQNKNIDALQAELTRLQG